MYYVIALQEQKHQEKLWCHYQIRQNDINQISLRNI